MEENIFTIDEVSKYLKIPKSTIYKLCQRNQMPFSKIGKQLRFRKTSVDNWLSEKETREPQIENRPIPRSFSEGGSSKSEEGEPERILLVDDDNLVLKAISRLLAIHGYEVTVVRTGQEALQQVKESRFSLLITDISMPGLDGIQTIKRIREFNKIADRSSIPEIIITGYIDTTAEEEAESLGITDYVYKPFQNAEFINTVKRKIGAITKLN
jgi:excisionase family DNA binding protein